MPDSFIGIIGRYFIARLDALESSVHLKMVNHDMEGISVLAVADVYKAKQIKEVIQRDILVSAMP